ncbi:hypothetical protein GA0061078_1269 [Bifidobacterium bohemicum]|nr:hypothetical protein GA0061078_1269 [Bifidobacterium bohemicum]
MLHGTVTAIVLLLAGLAWILIRNACAIAPPPPWHYDGSPVPKTGPFPRLLDRGPPNLGSLPGLSNSRKQQRNQLGP